MMTFTVILKGRRMTVVVPKPIALSDELWHCIMDGPNTFATAVFV